MQKDIENQFCIIDSNENSILVNKEIELLKLDNEYIINNSMKIYKFKKSKSYPDAILLSEKNNYNSDHNFIFNKNLNVKKKHININIKNITDEIYDSDENLNVNSNLIKKNKISYLYNNIKKICEYFTCLNFCNFKKINKIEILNKFMTICLHLFIMIIFEIYFYFNYVIWIEKNEFINQIDKYVGQLYNLPIDSTQKQLIKYEINTNNDKYQEYLDYLYNQYINSLNSQKKLLHKLLIKACTMGGIIGIVLIFLFILGLYNRKKIKWNWIWIENLLMFILLGIFEYFFFMTIIMHYNPITDAEVKYYAVNEFINYFNSTS
jgi:hypothetical protein